MAENLWLSFAFLTASIFATLALVDKMLLDMDSFGPITTSVLGGVPMMGVFIIAGVVTGNAGTGSVNSTPTMLVAIGIAMLGGIAYVVSLWTYFLGLETADVSRFVPLLSFDLIIVLALGFVLFGEGFNPVVYVGVSLIFLGTLLISLEDVTAGLNLHSRQALFWGMLVAGSTAVLNLVLKFMTSQMSLFEILFWVGVGGMVSLFGLAGWQWFRAEKPVELAQPRSLVKIDSAVICVRGVFIAVAFFTFVRALQGGPVSLATAILKLDVFLVFFGVLVLSRVAPEVLYERNERSILIQKLFASVFIVAGVVLIQSFTT